MAHSHLRSGHVARSVTSIRKGRDAQVWSFAVAAAFSRIAAIRASGSNGLPFSIPERRGFGHTPCDMLGTQGSVSIDLVSQFLPVIKARVPQETGGKIAK